MFKVILTLLTFAAAQDSNAKPPAACASQCNSVSFTSCKQTSTPKSNADWTSAANSMATCVCPIVVKAQDCTNCLISSTPEAATYLVKLQRDCANGVAAQTLASLWNVTIPASTPSGSGSSNSTGTSGTGSTSGLSTPPASYSTPASAIKNAAGLGLIVAVALAL
ncbi:hypothetical protein HDV06_004615 [Boothiomyces sp. JEL0866]|nr:hypothetical protein HDV06_004615 [Boothiomyces sp. JEL0866]